MSEDIDDEKEERRRLFQNSHQREKLLLSLNDREIQTIVDSLEIKIALRFKLFPLKEAPPFIFQKGDARINVSFC